MKNDENYFINSKGLQINQHINITSVTVFKNVKYVQEHKTVSGMSFLFYCFSTVSFTELYDKPEINNNSINI